MERYIAENFPGFFASADAQQPSRKLKELKKRCHQTARSLWYDWRHTLEEDLAGKLATVAAEVRAVAPATAGARAGAAHARGSHAWRARAASGRLRTLACHGRPARRALGGAARGRPVR